VVLKGVQTKFERFVDLQRDMVIEGELEGPEDFTIVPKE